LVEALTFEHLREHSARYSRVRLWGSIGFIVAALGAGALLDYMPLSSVLWGSVAMLAAIVLFSLLVPESQQHQHADTHQPVAEILRQPRVAALLAACFAMSAAHGALNIFYPIYLSGHGYSKSVVGSLLSLGVVAEILVFFFMSSLMRRFSLRQILLASFSAAVLRFMLIGWCVSSLYVLLFAQLLHSLTFGACHAAAIAAVNRWFPGRTRSRGQALYASFTFGAGGLIGGLVSGWSWDRLGGELTFAMSSIYALAGLLLVVKWVKEATIVEP
jgi:PPP family 3-phenylpropionic acid transporter